MAESEQSDRNANTRRQLIERAQLQCHEARERCLSAKRLLGDVPRENRHGFQGAIVDYYWSLRPLRNDGAVADWWSDVVLSESWTRTETSVNAALHGSGVQVDQSDEPVAGLDTLADLDDMTEPAGQRHVTMRGVTDESTTRQVVLPFPVLKDISGVLDDAAGKLGFTPSTPTPDEIDPQPV